MGLLDWFSSPPRPDAPTQALIGHAITLVDPLIGLINGHEQKLAPAVRHAMDYCDAIARRIPGPIEISRAAFAADPLVHALFGAAEDIEEMLAKSQCVREHLTEMTFAEGRCCALLGMRHREKSGFGVALEGDVVRMDVPQQTLYFTDHTLAEPSPNPEAARVRLSRVLFDGLVKGFAAHVADVRSEQQGLHQEAAIATACVRGGNDSEHHTRRLDALRGALHTTADALQPERLLETLAAALAAPEPYLSLDPVTVSVDRSGVITGRDQTTTGDTLQFAELTTRDMRRWVVMLAHIERDEARRAVERFETARRYIVI